MQNVGTQQDYTITQTEYWIKFNASDDYINIQLALPQSTPYANLQYIELYEGNCSSLILLKKIEASDTNLFYEGLNVNDQYYIKCSQANSNNSYFNIHIYAASLNNYAMNCDTDCNNIPIFNSDMNDDLYQHFNGNPNPNLYNSPLQVYNPNQAINALNNICGWYNYTGSPQIKRELLQNGTYNYYFFLYSQSNSYESILTRLNNGQTLTSKNYLLRFKQRRSSSAIQNVEVYMHTTHSLPSNATPVATINVTSTTWQSVEIPITNLNQIAQQKIFMFFIPTGTNGSGQHYDIDDIELLEYSMTVDPPNATICKGDQATITAELCDSDFDDQFSVTYNWTSVPIDYDIIGQNTNSTIVVSPLLSTLYFATVTTNTNISIMDFQPITVLPSPPLPEITGNIHSCDGLTSYNILNHSSSANYTYTIEINGVNTFGPYTVSSSNFSIDWTNTIYSTTAGLPVGGGNNWIIHMKSSFTNGCEKEFDMVVFPCCNSCISSGGYYYVDDVINQNTTINNSDICINGTLTIPSGIQLNVFGSSTINMGGNAQIIIEDGATLNMEGTIVHSCDQLNMWDKIIINGQNANLLALGCNFKDGKKAVHSVNGGYYDINQCIFEENYISISINDFNGDHQGIIKNTEFYGSYNLQFYPYINNSTLYGIEISNIIKDNSNLLIGDASSLSIKNLLNNHINAVYINNSDVTFRNAEFNDNTSCFDVIGSSNTPISTSNKRELIIGGALAYQEINFINSVEVLSLSQKTDLHFYYNNIDNATEAIKISHSYGTEINIVNNDFMNLLYGGIYFIDLMSIVNIQSNAINPSNTMLYGIQCFSNQTNLNPFIPSETYLCNNTISNAVVAINTNEIDRLVVNNNNITQINSSGGLEIGIYLANTDNATIINNQITYPNNPVQSDQSRVIGIYSYFAPFSHIYYNQINNNGSGIFIKENNHPASIAENTFNNNYNALCFENGDIGNQGSSNNAFNNTFNTNVWNFDVSPGNTPGIVPTIDWWFNPALNPALNNTSGAIFPQTASGTYTTWTNNCPAPPPAPPIAPNPFSNVISIDSLRFAELSGLIGLFYPTNANAMQFASLPNIYLSDKHYYYAQNAYNRLREKPDYRNVGNANDILYSTFYNQIHNTNIGLCAKIEDALISKKAKTAKYLLSNFQSQNYQEIISYEVYSIYANTWAKGIYGFSNSDSTTLDAIAHQQARLGGRAVFMARYMLGISVFEVNNSVIRKATDKTKNEELLINGDIKVYPNPADNQITFEFNNLAPNSELQIYNSLGRLVFSKILTDTKTNINTSELSSGIYLYRINSNNISETGKIIIN